MCDTFVARGRATKDGVVLFGKNSDREPNEAQEVSIFSAADYAPDAQVSCTYRAIPQVKHTFAVLLSKPFWMWGAEMGLNEHGVAIGNEAVFTRLPYESKGGLTGMDLLRLALERAETARAALDVITSLLEEYGQGGNCGFTHPFYYHNSFILADAQDAWVLETAGRHWAAEHVQEFRSISNGLTIGSEFDLASADLVSFAVERGWCKGRADFNFARCYSDILYTRLSDSNSRQACTMQLMRQMHGGLDIPGAFSILRAHGVSSSETWRPDHGLLGAEVCMHAGAGPVRGSQSVGSMVARLAPGQATAWVTGTAAPCTSVFKPVWIDAGLPDQNPRPQGTYDPHSWWWQHERLHRAILNDYAARVALIAPERNELEASFVAGELTSRSLPAAERHVLTQHCFETAAQAEQTWLEKVNRQPIQHSPAFYQRMAWEGFNRQAKLNG